MRLSFGARLRAAMDTHGPLCVGIDPHRALVEQWGLTYDLAGIERFALTCVEAFGASRCMFESNFPVDKAGFGYGVMWNAFKRLTASWSADERRALFHDTAARFYRIG